jgi:hypothetical protein
MKKEEQTISVMETGTIPAGTIVNVEPVEEILVVTDKDKQALRNYFKSLRK